MSESAFTGRRGGCSVPTMQAIIGLISLLWFVVRVSYAGFQWFRRIVADAFSKPGQEDDVPPGPLWRDEDKYRGD